MWIAEIGDTFTKVDEFQGPPLAYRRVAFPNTEVIQYTVMLSLVPEAPLREQDVTKILLDFPRDHTDEDFAKKVQRCRDGIKRHSGKEYSYVARAVGSIRLGHTCTPLSMGYDPRTFTRHNYYQDESQP